MRKTIMAVMLCFISIYTITAQEKQKTEPWNFKCYGRVADGVPNAEKLGLKVGIQYYTFHKYTFFEALEMTRALGLHYIEGCGGMKLSDKIKGGFGPGMSQEALDAMNEKLKENEIQIVSSYQWMKGDGNGFEDLCRFAQKTGIMIITDPKRHAEGVGSVDWYEDILKKYPGVKMAFTNHPKPIAYWNPDFTVEDTKGRSEHIGASVDIGHYMRGGFAPLPIVKRYCEIGKMYHFHFRDVSAIGKEGIDVAVGEGKGELKKLIKYLVKNDIHPLIMLEYEKDFDNPMPELIKSVNYINEVCGEIINEK